MAAGIYHVASQRLSADDCDLDEFRSIVEIEIDPTEYPLSISVDDGLVTYRGDELAALSGDERGRFLDELARALAAGPGVVKITGAVDHDVIDLASRTFEQIIVDQRTGDDPAGDHFAAPGANDRIWNALEKLAIRAPQTFFDYYRSPAVALASEAWLGPGYQMTSQVNVVNPGGRAQDPHRDYHLGFMTDEQATRYPDHVQRLSPLLTLQGAIAHCDMPAETGPTMYLPHSQKYPLGYLAWRRPEFIDYFGTNHRQPELATGDAAFFNPAVFHGAGTNRTTRVRRMANLLQVSSPFGRAMERIDRAGMCAALLPVLQVGSDPEDVSRVVAAAAEAYPFPTDLDRDQPVDGLAPPSQADLVRSAVADDWSVEALTAAMAEQATYRG